MSIGAILTLGMGSFGSVNLLPTLGYTPGTATPSVFGRSGLGGDDVPTPYRKSPELGWDKKAYESKKAREDAIEETLKKVYADLTGTAAPLSVLARVDEIVKPVAKRVKKDAPLVIDWKAMAQREKQAKKLLALWNDEQALKRWIEEDDEIIMLMMQ